MDLNVQKRDRNWRILLVDDEEAFREAMVFSLVQNFGAITTELPSGEKAIELLKTGYICDIVFLDIMMKPINGLQTYREINLLRPGLPVAMMSAYTGPEWKEAETLDILALLSKPFGKQEITDVLNRLH